MAYQYVELPTREGSIDEKLIRTYTRTFQVIVDDSDRGPGEIADLVPLSMFASWSAGGDTDLTALLKKKSARMTGQQDGGYVWEVTCEYDSAPFDSGEGGTEPAGSPGQAQTQPDLRPWTIEFGSVKTTKILTKDVIDDSDVVASNGQPFDPAPEVPAHHPQITITAYKPIASESLSNVRTYTNKVNQGTWQGFPDQTVLCTEYKLQSQFEHGQWWWQKTVVLEVNPDAPWNPVKILDCGTVTRVSMTEPFRPILDGSGSPVTSPVPLKNGQPLPFGEDLQYIEKNGYKKVSFAGLI